MWIFLVFGIFQGVSCFVEKEDVDEGAVCTYVQLHELWLVEDNDDDMDTDSGLETDLAD